MVADMEIPAKKSTFIRCGEITAVVVVITVVWGLAFLPAVFYFLPQVSIKATLKLDHYT